LTSPFGNIFSTTILGALESEAWQKLVRDGFEGVQVDVVTLNWIDDLAGGWPFYVQMAAALLWQEGNRTLAEKAFALQAEQRLRELWKSLSQVDQSVVQQSGGEDITVIKKLQRYGIIRANGKLFSKEFVVLGEVKE
jgi:hypothetical protein